MLDFSNYHRENVIKRSLVIGDQRNTVCAKIRGIRGGLDNDSPNRPGMAAMAQPTRIMMAPRNHGSACDTVIVSKSKSSNDRARSGRFIRQGGGGEIAPAPLFQFCQDYGASTRTESTAATITRAGRVNTPPAINFQISRPPFLNFWLLDPAERTLDALKRC